MGRETMKDENRIEFDSALLKVAKLYGYNLDKEQAGLYFEILKDVEIEAVKRAMIRAARVCKFMPKPAEILENLMENRMNQWDYDYEYCRSMAKEMGENQSIVLGNKMLMAVITDLGGLAEFVQKVRGEDKDFYFAFVRAWKRRKIDEETGSLPNVPRLPGLLETQGEKNGLNGAYRIYYWDKVIGGHVNRGDVRYHAALEMFIPRTGLPEQNLLPEEIERMKGTVDGKVRALINGLEGQMKEGKDEDKKDGEKPNG